MLWSSVLSRLFRPPATSSKPTRKRSNRLRAELLESRDVPATFSVTNGGDSGPGSLRDAIVQSQVILADGDEIVIDPGVTAILLASPLPDLAEAHTIRATPTPAGLPSVVIAPVAAQFQQFRFAEFLPSGATLTLRGLQLDGFGASDPIFGVDIDGGAIKSLGDLALYNCWITDCVATGSGGAISTDKSLTLDTCYFGFNNSGASGGAIYSTSTSVVVWSFANSIFDNNTALNSGGAVYLLTADATGFTCTQCHFIENNALEGDGGAICMIQGRLSVTTSLIFPGPILRGFVSNQAGGKGGGIYTFSSTSVYVNVILTGGNMMGVSPFAPPVANNVYVELPRKPVDVYIAPGNAPFIVIPPP